MSNDDTYTRHDCPQCGVVNVVACGDPNDCTSSMGEDPACLCWSCGHKFWRVDINDSDVIFMLKSYGDWNPRKSAKKNLEAAAAEEGKPSETFESNKYERFLDAPCTVDPFLQQTTTWRGFVLSLLKASYGKDFWSVPRKERIAAIEGFLRKPIDFREQIAAGLEKAGISVKHLWGDDKGKTDWLDFYREIKGMLLYLSGISWHEIKHDDRKDSGSSADPKFRPPE